MSLPVWQAQRRCGTADWSGNIRTLLHVLSDFEIMWHFYIKCKLINIMTIFKLLWSRGFPFLAYILFCPVIRHILSCRVENMFCLIWIWLINGACRKKKIKTRLSLVICFYKCLTPTQGNIRFSNLRGEGVIQNYYFLNEIDRKKQGLKYKE